MIDVDKAIRTTLLASTGITGKVGNRIYCPNLPPGYSPENTAIEYSVRGGRDFMYVPLVQPSIQIKCWGPTMEDAREVYGVLHSYLKDIRRHQGSDFTLMGCQMETFGQDLIDIATGWYNVLSFWTFTFLE